ncbi:hypothetical protein NHX12_005365 [Muraenolepis orangiensis]|uniref:Ras-associating domain-containing protein n=1 Tax=Muraenolepis orangiensis TaxID=630683 RepID=A0A9Q0DUW4_9TELE|nr:hypothetical protein NHX12_005365 [Muraenolepis orangiensis]
MQAEERQISVWVCQEEKLILGFSKRTTCADVVRVLLLEDHHNAQAVTLPRKPNSHCIMEIWRGLERVLTGNTRLLRLWDAWGVEEQGSVKFVLVKHEASVGTHGPSRSALQASVGTHGPSRSALQASVGGHGPSRSAQASVGGHGPSRSAQASVGGHGPSRSAQASVGGHGPSRSAQASVGGHGPSRSAQARVVRSKDNPHISTGPTTTTTTTPSATMCMSPGKQRRIVSKAFRKLKKMNKKKVKAASGDATAEHLATMVHRVVSQDRTLRQQVQGIHELDKEIERYETKVHVDRMKSHGVNYVQDVYLVEGLERPHGSTCDIETELSSVDTITHLEEYVRQCQEMVTLQERLEGHEALVDSMTRDIQEELNRRWMERRRRRRRDEKSRGTHVVGLPAENDFLLDHVERIRTELDTSLYIGLRLDTDLDVIENDLQRTEESLRAREREVHALLKDLQMNTWDADEEKSTFEKCNSNVPTEREMMCSLETKNGWIEQTKGCSSSQDDDSDTGISSLHSQDSDTYPVISLTLQ